MISRQQGRAQSGRTQSGRTLSGRQQQVLDLIKATVSQRGYPPSVREIGEALGLSSPSTVHSHLSALVAAGLLRRDPSKPRAIEVLDVKPTAVPPGGDRVRQVPWVGRIAAGTPILAEEAIEDIIPLPVDIVGTGPVFLLTVKGDSMVGAGILDGDLVVVRSQPDAEDGEIVAAMVDGEEATVKRLRRRDGSIHLVSENPDYPAMVFEGGVEVLGKVVAVLRKVR